MSLLKKLGLHTLKDHEEIHHIYRVQVGPNAGNHIDFDTFKDFAINLPRLYRKYGVYSIQLLEETHYKAVNVEPEIKIIAEIPAYKK